MSVTDELSRSFQMYEDLAASLSETDLGRDLPVPSNTIWDQFWCVVGGRESYVKAVEAGEWVGFSCSLGPDTRGRKEPLTEALTSSASSVHEVSGADANDRELLLLLHEIQHQGQLIRFLLGLELPVPESWSKRWSL